MSQAPPSDREPTRSWTEWAAEALARAVARVGPARRKPPRSDVEKISIVPLTEGEESQADRAAIEHALGVIRENAPEQHAAAREALHRDLLGAEYNRVKGNIEPAKQLEYDLQDDLEPVLEAARARGLEAAKDTIVQLALCVESAVDTQATEALSQGARDATWTKSRREKIPSMRRDAKQRLEAGGDPNLSHRVAKDFELEGGWRVPGTVTDRYLAFGKPNRRQGPQVLHEQARQILFELTKGLGLSDYAASAAVSSLLRLYVGDLAEPETLRRWWFRHRPSRPR